MHIRFYERLSFPSEVYKHMLTGTGNAYCSFADNRNFAEVHEATSEISIQVESLSSASIIASEVCQ